MWQARFNNDSTVLTDANKPDYELLELALFAALFFVHFFNNALITLTVGPLCSEAVPVALMATASGLVIAVGELFGGGIAPVLVGHLAQRLGIEQILKLPIAMLGVGLLLCMTIRGPTDRMPLILRRPAP